MRPKPIGLGYFGSWRPTALRPPRFNEAQANWLGILDGVNSVAVYDNSFNEAQANWLGIQADEFYTQLEDVELQ